MYTCTKYKTALLRTLIYSRKGHGKFNVHKLGYKYLRFTFTKFYRNSHKCTEIKGVEGNISTPV